MILRLAWAWCTQPSRDSLRRVTFQSPLAPRLFSSTTTACSALRYSTMSDSESEAFDLNGVSGGSDSEEFALVSKKVCGLRSWRVQLCMFTCLPSLRKHLQQFPRPKQPPEPPKRRQPKRLQGRESRPVLQRRRIRSKQTMESTWI